MVASAHIPDGHRVVLAGVSWDHYEVELVMRGEKSVPRIAYLEGALELMRPSREHERITSYLGRLIEVFAELHDIKLAIYQRLGIAEVWFWIDGKLEVHALQGGAYERVTQSQWLPGLDLELMCSFLDRRAVHVAKRDFRAALARR
jgi:Uma2 family endonuclease